MTTADTDTAGRVAQALQDTASALPVLLDAVPTLMERVDELGADAAILRRMLWVRHGCPITEQWQDAAKGQWRCLACGCDFGNDTVAELRAKLSLVQRPPQHPAQLVTVVDHNGDVPIPMNANWKPGKPEDWADKAG